ncbi:MAG: adenylate/guanylate cyclase domain-containing protein [Leptospiraceae bacterium]|nr:adenylate/guanylate cyclase domain-containing protein [Leptospiraceae bacterium]
MEDFRNRLKARTRELKKYRRLTSRVVEKKSWFTKNVLGKLNTLSRNFIDTRDKRRYFYVDTYFSSYINAEKLALIEDNIKAQMRDINGVPISKNKFGEIQKLANKIVVVRNELEEEKEKLTELSFEIQDKDSKKFQEKQKKLSDKIQEYEKKLNDSLFLLNKEINDFFYKQQKESIEEMGLNTSLIRIQSFGMDETKVNFDTNIFDEEKLGVNASDFTSSGIIRDELEERVKTLDIKKLIQPESFSKEIKIEGKVYEIFFRPSLRNHVIAERARLLLLNLKKPSFSEIFINMLEQEEKLAAEFKTLSDKLRERLKELREKKKGKPSKDKDFRQYYSQYNKLLDEREKLYNKYFPLDKPGLSVRERKLYDAIHQLREVALYEYSILRFRYRSGLYKSYFRDKDFQNIALMKYNNIRKWIISASSETDIPSIKYNKTKIDTLEGGILSHSRSEIEEEMWRLDSQTLLGKGDSIDGLANTLFISNVAGFTRTIVDKTEGLSKIRSDIEKIVSNAGFVGITAIALAFLFSSVMVRNIRKLSRKAAIVGMGSLDVSFDIKSRDEIGSLSKTLTSMVTGLIERDKMKDALRKFVNPEIAEMVLKKELRLGGEKKNAAIFFSDIRSFTAISEALEPEEVVEFLNEYMTVMVKCINNTHGIVDKFIGDAIMATWGAAYSRGNDAENAIDAALTMRKELIKFNEGRGEAKKPIIKIGCGINFGPVIAGQIGSEERLEYTVIGDAVNLASRVEALNKPFGTDILITEDLYKLVSNNYRLEKMKAIKVKGKSAPQTIYAVLGRKDDESCPKSIQELRTLLKIETPKENKSGDEEEVKYEILE